MTEESPVDVELTLEGRGVKTTLKSQVKMDKVDETLASFVISMIAQQDKIKELQQKGTSQQQNIEKPITQEIVAQPITSADEPLVNIANDLGVTVEQLKSARILGFKAGIDRPQLLSPTKFSPEAGALAILYGFEIGLGKNFATYDEANETFMMGHYKVGAIAARVVPNLKRQNKIDQGRYDRSKELTLTPAGLEFARKELKKALGIA